MCVRSEASDHDIHYNIFFPLLPASSRCQRVESRYLKLSSKHQTLARKHRELEKFQQKQSVLLTIERATSTTSVTKVMDTVCLSGLRLGFSSGGGGGGWVARANGPNEFIMSCLGAYHPYMKQ